MTRYDERPGDHDYHWRGSDDDVLACPECRVFADTLTHDEGNGDPWFQRWLGLVFADVPEYADPRGLSLADMIAQEWTTPDGTPIAEAWAGPDHA